MPTIATANTIGDISNSGTNVANYSGGAAWNGQNGNVTTVGSAGTGSESFYGTSDQGGNVWEWNEEVLIESLFSSRGLRGGSWTGNEVGLVSSLRTLAGNPAVEIDSFGFRVASPVSRGAIPTVSEWGLIVMALLLLAGAKVYFNRRRTART